MEILFLNILLAIITCLILGFIAAVWLKFRKTPYSFSEAYYKLEREKTFCWIVGVVAVLNAIVMFTLSDSLYQQILSILTNVGMLGVAIEPDFNEDKKTNLKHCISAGLLLVASQLWVIDTKFWYVSLIIWCAFIAYIVTYIFAKKKDTLKQSFLAARPMLYCELGAWGSYIISAFLLANSVFK